jgi:hypothetical protein
MLTDRGLPPTSQIVCNLAQEMTNRRVGRTGLANSSKGIPLPVNIPPFFFEWGTSTRNLASIAHLGSYNNSMFSDSAR